MVICSNYPTEAVKVIFAKDDFLFCSKILNIKTQKRFIPLKNQQTTIFSYEF